MRGSAIFFLCFISISGWSQSGQPADHDQFRYFAHAYMQTDDNSYSSGSTLDHFIVRLEEKQKAFKRDVDFLQYLFTKTHNRFLKEYRDYSTFSQLVQKGYYNCLTGTALYALLLQHFNFDYAIMETNSHIFLLVQTGEQRILFEATDPVYGFVTAEHDVNERIARYQDNTLSSSSEKTYYKFRSNLYKKVSLHELTGLLYYNQSVDAYNNQNLYESIALLEKASGFYRSQRMDEFSAVILMAIMESDLEMSSKQVYTRKIQALLL